MKTFKIEGGHQLKGEIQPQGAKNEALQILCALLLTPEKVTIHNIPDIVDVNKLIALLGKLGVKIRNLKHGSYEFQADEINMDYLESEEFKVDGRGLRGSIMIVGPLLARFGRGYIPKPGGDKIGRRRLDTHFEGFIRLGAKFRYNKLNLGDIGGIPRVLDAGQCNDSYSLAVIALKLKEVFELEDINDLPLSFDIAWYEQKAVLVLLALLFLAQYCSHVDGGEVGVEYEWLRVLVIWVSSDWSGSKLVLKFFKIALHLVFCF